MNDIRISGDITTNVHRAPTDESIKLLNEMQHKAKENIIATIQIDENFIKAIGIYFRDSIIEDRMSFMLRFYINSVEYALEGYVNKFEWREEMRKSYMGLGNEQVYMVLIKKFAEIIAINLLEQSPDFLKTIPR